MNRAITVLILILAAATKAFSSATVQPDSTSRPLCPEAKTALVDSITASYTPWHKVSMSGKLSSRLLLVSPSVKLYMEKGELMILSMSVPLIGEVVRIEADKDSIIAVNKMKDQYTAEAWSRITPHSPIDLVGLQNLALGRITVPRKGELSRKNAGSVEIFSSGDGDWEIVPDTSNPECECQYDVNASSLRLSRYMGTSDWDNANLNCWFDWDGDKKNFSFIFDTEHLYIDFKLKLNKPNYEPKKLKRMSLGKKYEKVSLYEFLKM